MRSNVLALVRLGLVVAVVGFVTAPPAFASRSSEQQSPMHTAAGSRAGRSPEGSSEQPEEPRGDPIAGVIWIAVAIAILVFLAWLAMRVGDPRTPSDGIPN